MMLLRLSTLATGRTGVRPEVAQIYAAMLSAGLTPVVYEYGSLGCSGDLAPLAHVALAAIGEGTVRTADGELLPSAEALARHGIELVVLAEKEGLALINGTDGMLGMLVLALRDLDALLKLADVTASMSVEGQLGSTRVFAEDLHAMRPHPGQAAAAEHAACARRIADRGQPQRTGLLAGPGRVLAALRTPGRGRGARHRRACPHRRRPRIGKCGGQSRRHP